MLVTFSYELIENVKSLYQIILTSIQVQHPCMSSVRNKDKIRGGHQIFPFERKNHKSEIKSRLDVVLEDNLHLYIHHLHFAS